MEASGIASIQQVPGYYRHRVGKVLVTALYDGEIFLAPSLFHGINPGKMQTLIADKFQMQNENGVQTAVTTYLIDNGTERILFNTGGAKGFAATMGNIQGSLCAAGYSAEDISAILLTHMHFDHVCGLVNEDGSPAFVNATVFASDAECNFWLNPKTAQAAPEGSRAFFDMAVRSVAPYIDKGAFSRFKDGDRVLPGIQAISTPGHTPGHTSYLVTSEGEELLLWGDIVHSHAMQFSYPEVSNDFDSDQPKAVATRQAIFQEAARKNWLIGGDHLPFPGLGHLKNNANGYVWVPIEYSPLGQ